MSPLEKAAPRLADLIRLLASDHDGEVIASVRALQRTLKSAGCDLNDLGDLVERAPRHMPAAETRHTWTEDFQTVNVDGRQYSWRACVEALIHKYAGHINEWALNFVNSLRRRTHITEKQRNVLERICNEVSAKLPFGGPDFEV